MRTSFYFHLAFRILANKFRRKLGYPAIPYKVLWNTTYYCNSRCKTCNIWQIYPLNGGSQNDELEPDEVSRIVSSLGKNLLWLTMTGGEPTLRRHMADTVNAIYDACPRLAFITVNTNSILPKRTLKVMEAIASHCRRAEVHAVLSLDGVGDVHDNVRGVPGNFNSVIEAYRGLTEMKERLPNLRIGFQSTVSRYNLDRLPELVEFCRHKGDEHSITFSQEAELYQNHGDGHDVTTDRDVLLHVLEDLIARYHVRRFGEYLQWAHLRLMRRYIATRRAPVPCTAASSSVTLGPKGEVTGCLFLDNRIGNAKEYSYDLLRMIRSEPAKAVQTACSNCSQCWTNCESFPSMMSSPFKTLVRALRPRFRRHLAGTKSPGVEVPADLEPVPPS
jgi:MoaA/NifB/PqqE/SkfB family radical SAM enzyme